MNWQWNGAGHRITEYLIRVLLTVPFRGKLLASPGSSRHRHPKRRFKIIGKRGKSDKGEKKRKERKQMYDILGSDFPSIIVTGRSQRNSFGSNNPLSIV
jgi:hypothetical protein